MKSKTTLTVFAIAFAGIIALTGCDLLLSVIEGPGDDLEAENAGQYAVTYNANGATAGSIPAHDGLFSTGDTITVLENSGNLVRTGYNYIAWNTQANGLGTNYAPGQTFTMGSSEVILYAVWDEVVAEPTYSVTYNGNNASAGIAPVDSATYEEGVTVTVLDNTSGLARTGYIFAGWNTQPNGLGTDYAPGATFLMGGSDLVLYALWNTEAPTYTVTYYSYLDDGGTVPVDGALYDSGAMVTILDNTGDLTRDGYIFAGWNTAANGSATAYAAGDTLTMPMWNFSLFAQWEIPTFALNYDANGATGGTPPIDTDSYVEGESVTILHPSDLNKTDHSFRGWTTTADNSGTTFVPGDYYTFSPAVPTLFAKWVSSGTFDPSFSGGTGPNSGVYDVLVQSDGSVLIGGGFTSYDGTGRNDVARLNADGSIDTAFEVAIPLGGGEVFSLAVQSDEKILIGGSFSIFDGSTFVNGFERLNSDGTIDAAFLPGTGTNASGGEIYKIAIQPDGKIMVGGSFTSIDGTPRQSLARLNEDGTLDTGFEPFGISHTSGMYVADVRAIALQSDGKILIGGNFTAVNGVARNGIARLNDDGTLDAGFDPGSGANLWTETVGPDTYTYALPVRAIEIDEVGKIMVGGSFQSFNGGAPQSLVRLTVDGSVDSTFVYEVSLVSVYDLAVQSNGSIVAGGASYLVRLLPDGAQDDTFDIGQGPNNVVRALALDTEGYIFIGGDFQYYNANFNFAMGITTTPRLLKIRP